MANSYDRSTDGEVIHKLLLSVEQKLRYIFYFILFLITVSITDFILTKKKQQKNIKQKKTETFTIF